MSHTLTWPKKGDPAPTVRGADPVEALIVKVDGWIARAPLNAEYLAMLNTVVGDANNIYLTLNPDGQKQAQRLAIVNGLIAQGAAGIPGLVAYAEDDPSHPDDTTELAMWGAVQAGYEPTSPTLATTP